MVDDPSIPVPVVATEVRVLEGPNLYFTRPAIKVSLRLPGYLAADEPAMQALAGELRLPRSAPGPAGTASRQRFVVRLVERVVRRLAAAAGTVRLGVRVRPGGAADEIVVALPWRSRERGQAMGEAIAPLLQRVLETTAGDPAGEQAVATAVEEAAAGIRAVPEGPRPRTTAPKVPVVAITGTNGKTTTTRLVAHLGMIAGLRTGWSSTDGVLVQGELVEKGDYSGPAGAQAVLSAPGVQLAVLETARGGMLFKGLGVPVNDVSVVTNVSADHLGMQGIDTIDQLAEVKAIITRVTKPQGWVVLNGDDPRVWAMRTGASGRIWCFSLDPDSPSLREALQSGGRGITVLDGDLVVLSPGHPPERLVSVLDVPMTLGGLSAHNLANALAGAAAGLGAGLSPDAVAEGLATFAPDSQHNAGRMNIYSTPLAGGGEVTVILDMAHNEGGLEALLRVGRGLVEPGSQLLLGLGTGGDRTDEILRTLGVMAGLEADRVHVQHKEKYLRDRTMDELEALLVEGLGQVGVTPVSSSPTELEGLEALLADARDGDVLAMMTHSHRAQLHDWLLAQGSHEDDPATVRRKVIRARGEHEAEERIAALWAIDDADERIVQAQELREAFPDDARVLYELAGTYDSADREDEALAAYDDALRLGLREPYYHRALIQKASTLRHLGRLEESLAILDALRADRPDSEAVAAFRALTLHDLGDDGAALGDVLRLLVQRSKDADMDEYRSALVRFGDEID
ncbi:cyanophycin synthetase [Barrientosiimonas humi]|uniref:Cyanophycin synthetase n=1 Tax=Barrientosiimonas humi TaxID=999931 RepID=A0A542XBY7_9MICO|nr:tetratricopeptide repeat protein [Barrientosiimonas humi]TQL33246.1 cyanophycin synthetase [Barrientosiimonas humi]CAG7573235.1 Cyanophycin synthetase [Barrientosiimonas humi]